ncbi:hypothetical protein Smp_032710 [Schistosoma mansoni]|uniref:hypothetical protein n=1 Tax=Schistosoma mansoni TaxID=6183 RepID=UPI0001A63601|nr:hypothetical protein Smp_032710 [Schistosoma mansoni]|eukprot:XP_018649584.1 hypothetical protein Smp_032710 [Schistosoma mansoni]
MESLSRQFLEKAFPILMHKVVSPIPQEQYCVSHLFSTAFNPNQHFLHTQSTIVGIHKLASTYILLGIFALILIAALVYCIVIRKSKKNEIKDP